MININKVLLVLMSALVSACASYDEKTAGASASGLTVCNDPRPQVCTLEYDPVCATYNNGSKKTSSTGCTACSDPEVVAYAMAACEAVGAE